MQKATVQDTKAQGRRVRVSAIVSDMRAARRGAAARGPLGLTADPSLEIAWRAAGERRAEAPAAASLERDLGLEVVRSADSWRVFVTPAYDVRLTQMRATLAFDLRSYDRIFLSGYNCWTDSVERPLEAGMPGLTRVPRRTIDKWVLDGAGDYRFVPEDPRPGRQHGFSYGYLRRGDEVALFGSLDEGSGFTLIRENLSAGTITLEKEVPERVLPAGKRHEACSFGVFCGSLDDAFAAWLAASGISCRPALRLVGYSSWYRHYTDINAEKLTHDLDGLVETLGAVKAPGARKVFQVDDGYTKVGDWLTPDPQKFPDGMAPVAAAAREQGYLPGIWMAPFVCERASRLFAEHPDWLLRDAHGRPVPTGSHWSGQVALDTQVPAVRAYVRESIRCAVQDWGFGFLKLDFLYGACMLPHADKNRGELMADAAELLREAAGEDVLLDFCGVPMVAAFGRAHYSRVGADVGLDWDDKPLMRLMHRERVSTRCSLANTRGRAHLDGVALGCDPDVFFLRDDVDISAERRAELLEADVSLGSILFTSDDMGAWTAEQRATYREAVRRFCERPRRGGQTAERPSSAQAETAIR